MTKDEVIKEISQLSIEERLTIIELLVHQMRKEMSIKTEHDNDLLIGAKALLEDYRNDKELTIFTQIDSEEFHETS